jgi:hypothetical protein
MMAIFRAALAVQLIALPAQAFLAGRALRGSAPALSANSEMARSH